MGFKAIRRRLKRIRYEQARRRKLKARRDDHEAVSYSNYTAKSSKGFRKDKFLGVTRPKQGGPKKIVRRAHR